MTVLDAYALVALLADEPAADEVVELLRDRAAMSTVNVAEAMDQLVRIKHKPVDVVRLSLRMIGEAGVDALPVTIELGLHAGQLRARYYHRKTCSISLADCVAAATALAGNRPLATSDPALAAVVRAEGGDVIALPDRQGRRP